GFSGVALSADDLRVGAAEFRQPGCASSAGAAAGSASGARAAAVAPPVARTRRTGFVAGGGDPDHPHIAGADRRTIAGSGPPPLAVAGSIIVHRDRKRGSLRCKPPCAITLRSPRSPQLCYCCCCAFHVQPRPARANASAITWCTTARFPQTC